MNEDFKQLVQQEKDRGYGADTAHLIAIVKYQKEHGEMPFKSEAEVNTLIVTTTTKLTIKEMMKKVGEGQKIKLTR